MAKHAVQGSLSEQMHQRPALGSSEDSSQYAVGRLSELDAPRHSYSTTLRAARYPVLSPTLTHMLLEATMKSVWLDSMVASRQACPTWRALVLLGMQRMRLDHRISIQ